MVRRLAYVWLVAVGLNAVPRRAIAAAGPGVGASGSAPGAASSATSPSDPMTSEGEMGSSSTSSDTTLLEVIVNGHSTGKIGEFTLRHGLLYVRPDELRALGFRVPEKHVQREGGLIGLSSVPGIRWTIDVPKQQLLVTAVDEALIPSLLEPNMGETGRRRPIESGTGITLNYDNVGSFAGGQNSGSGSFDLRSFASWGIVNTDWLAYAGAGSTTAGRMKAIRLDSAYSYADVSSLRRFSLGDFINGGLNWNRSIHMEGLQVRSDFSMRPDLVTFPLPSIRGSAAVPSTVDVLVNGNLVASQQVEPGPFEVNQLPVISGAGAITMSIINAQGQQVTITQPFYGGSTLLAHGLHTFGVQAGLVRRNWGTASDDYGKMATTAYYRRGMTDKFTIEASGEGTPGAYLGGAGGALVVSNLGTINFDLAASGGSGAPGGLASVGAQHIGTRFNLGGSASWANRGYRDVASMNGSGVLRKQLSAFTGANFRRLGSLGLAYAEIAQDSSPVAISSIEAFSDHSHVVTANYSVQYRHVALYANEFRTLDAGGSSGLQVGVTIPIGRRRSVALSGSSSGNGQAQIQQSPVVIGDWGYEAYISEGDANHEFGQLQYKSAVGLLTAGVDFSSGQSTVRLESQGAISLVDGGLFPSNYIYDSFAVVDTAPLKHVEVYQENRAIGRTGRAGRLLVPDMRSFDVNHIGIAATDVPPDATISMDKQIVRPQDRSGVVVRFPIQFSRGALLKLVDQAGTPIPMGSMATLQATGSIVPVGYDGDVYVEGLSSHNELIIQRTDGRRCRTAFAYKPIPGDIPSIGPLRCVER